MTIANRKERQKEELRSKILQAARELFMQKGFEDTSIRNIAEKIEYSPTTIYLYFKDKDEIFHALHVEGFTLLNQYFKPLALVSDPFERLKAICRAYTTFAMENGEYYDLMFIIRSPMDSIDKHDKKDPKWEEGERAFGFLVYTISECMAKGYFNGMDPEIMAFTCWSMVHGIVSLQIRQRCSVISLINQDNLVEKAGNTVIEILERMQKSPQ
jgi:AcrR family transcriptional regulator